MIFYFFLKLRFLLPTNLLQSRWHFLESGIRAKIVIILINLIYYSIYILVINLINWLLNFLYLSSSPTTSPHNFYKQGKYFYVKCLTNRKVRTISVDPITSYCSRCLLINLMSLEFRRVLLSICLAFDTCAGSIKLFLMLPPHFPL